MSLQLEPGSPGAARVVSSDVDVEAERGANNGGS